MTVPRGREPSAWQQFREFLAELREFAVEIWREQRADPQPLPVLYLVCDGCGQVTPRTSVQKSYSLTERGLAGGTPESVCDRCRHAQPRVVDDAVPADTTVICTGHRFRRIGIKRSRKPCGESFTVPAAATLVICPWCVTTQPGPGTSA